MFDLSPETLRHSIESVGYASAGVSFMAGLVFSFSPVSVAAIPVALAYVSKAGQPSEARRLVRLFILGMILTHVVLGALAGLGGHWVSSLMGRVWGALLGPVLILLGLAWTGWVKLPLSALALRIRRPIGAWGAFLLGIPFSVAVCPVCTPALLALLGVVAVLGSPVLGAVVLLAFAVGRAAPMLLGAWTLSRMEGLPALRRFRQAFNGAAGVTLIATGLYLLNAYYMVIPQWAGLPKAVS